MRWSWPGRSALLLTGVAVLTLASAHCGGGTLKLYTNWPALTAGVDFDRVMTRLEGAEFAPIDHLETDSIMARGYELGSLPPGRMRVELEARRGDVVVAARRVELDVDVSDSRVLTVNLCTECACGAPECACAAEVHRLSDLPTDVSGPASACTPPRQGADLDAGTDAAGMGAGPACAARGPSATCFEGKPEGADAGACVAEAFLRIDDTSDNQPVYVVGMAGNGRVVITAWRNGNRSELRVWKKAERAGARVSLAHPVTTMSLAGDYVFYGRYAGGTTSVLRKSVEGAGGDELLCELPTDDTDIELWSTDGSSVEAVFDEGTSTYVYHCDGSAAGPGVASIDQEGDGGPRPYSKSVVYRDSLYVGSRRTTSVYRFIDGGRELGPPLDCGDASPGVTCGIQDFTATCDQIFVASFVGYNQNNDALKYVARGPSWRELQLPQYLGKGRVNAFAADSRFAYLGYNDQLSVLGSGIAGIVKIWEEPGFAVHYLHVDDDFVYFADETSRASGGTSDVPSKHFLRRIAKHAL